jgi:nicotinamidase-related amidase
MTRALVIIDIQNDYFPGGAYPLVGPGAAAENAAAVLAAFRAAGDPVVHIRHVWDAPDATFMRPGTAGVEIHSLVTPADGETVLQKTEPNAFLGTGLEPALHDLGADELVVVGMMSSMCVDSSVRAASDLGFRVTVVHDACAAPDLEFGGRTVPGDVVHAAFMAALGDSFARLVSTAEFLGR